MRIYYLVCLTAACVSCFRRCGLPRDQFRFGKLSLPDGERPMYNVCTHSPSLWNRFVYAVGMQLSWGARRSHEMGHGQLCCWLAIATNCASITSSILRNRRVFWNHLLGYSRIARPHNKVNAVITARTVCELHSTWVCATGCVLSVATATRSKEESVRHSTSMAFRRRCSGYQSARVS